MGCILQAFLHTLQLPPLPGQRNCGVIDLDHANPSLWHEQPLGLARHSLPLQSAFGSGS